jgi:small-conductance mechanosensitive channel
MSWDGYGYGSGDEIYNQGGLDPTLTRGLSNRVYKLSTQTNIVMFGYLLLMMVNHMTLGETIFSDTVKFKVSTETTNTANTTNTNLNLDENKRTWGFALIIFFTIINAFLFLLLKEKKRPVVSVYRQSNIIPIMFTIFQFIILVLTLSLYFILAPTETTLTKKIMTSIVFTFLNISVMLSTWGFASSRCSIDRTQMR